MFIVWILIAVAAFILCGCLTINLCRTIEKNEEFDIDNLFEWPGFKDK